MKNLFLLILSIIVLTSCSKDDTNINATKITQAKITLKNTNGDLLQNEIIFVHVFDFRADGNYAYASDTEMEGIRTNELGIAFFENLEYPGAFTVENNNERVFGFDAFNGNANKKLEVTFKKGDNKEFEIKFN